MVAGVVGYGVVRALPDRYEASARAYVDTDTILKPLMKGITVQPAIEQQVEMMARTLVSQPNVERIIRMADLDSGVVNEHDRDALVQRLMRDVQFKRAGGPNLYRITYRAETAKQAYDVVNSLLSIFVEGALGSKRRDSEGARQFIDRQVETYERRLAEAERKLKEFKSSNLAAMPALARDYVSRAAEAQRDVERARLELAQMMNSTAALRQQLHGEPPTLVASRDVDGKALRESGATPAEQRVAAARARLAELSRDFTDRHPDVVAARELVASLEGELATSRRLGSGSQPADSPITAPNKVYQELKIALAKSEAQVASLRVALGEAESRLNEARANAQTVPAIEAEYAQLTRDYTVTKRQYEELLARREQASISGSMDSSFGIGDFKIVDPPYVMPEPVWPKRSLALLGTLAASLVAGTGAAVLRNRASPTFHFFDEVRAAIKRPIIGTVQAFSTPARRLSQWAATTVFWLLALAYIAAYGLVIVRHQIGRWPTISGLPWH